MSIHLIPFITGLLLVILGIVCKPIGNQNLMSKIIVKVIPVFVGVSNIAYALYQMGVLVVI